MLPQPWNQIEYSFPYHRHFHLSCWTSIDTVKPHFGGGKPELIHNLFTSESTRDARLSPGECPLSSASLLISLWMRSGFNVMEPGGLQIPWATSASAPASAIPTADQQQRGIVHCSDQMELSFVRPLGVDIIVSTTYSGAVLPIPYFCLSKS